MADTAQGPKLKGRAVGKYIQTISDRDTPSPPSTVYSMIGLDSGCSYMTRMARSINPSSLFYANFPTHIVSIVFKLWKYRTDFELVLDHCLWICNSVSVLVAGHRGR